MGSDSDEKARKWDQTKNGIGQNRTGGTKVAQGQGEGEVVVFGSLVGTFVVLALLFCI